MGFPEKSVYTLDDCALFMMAMAASIDIDTPLDLCIAQAVLSMSNKNQLTYKEIVCQLLKLLIG